MEADLVLGGDDGKECTYSKGYMKRQAIFSCITCTPDGNAGVCTACSLSCHDGNQASSKEALELYQKESLLDMKHVLEDDFPDQNGNYVPFHFHLRAIRWDYHRNICWSSSTVAGLLRLPFCVYVTYYHRKKLWKQNLLSEESSANFARVKNDEVSGDAKYETSDSGGPAYVRFVGESLNILRQELYCDKERPMDLSS